MKHVGIIENVGKRCIVVFREIYDETGAVIEPDNCLVVETDTLPDFAHQDIMSIVESEPAQRTGNLYEVLARTRISDGSIALSWLSENGRLKKIKTNNVILLPDSNIKIKLNKINRIIELQKSGYSEKDIERIIQDDDTGREASKRREKIEVSSPNKNTLKEDKNTTVVDNIITDDQLARSLLEQADQFLKEAKRLTEQAHSLAPSLKPKKRKTVLKKPKELTTEK